MRKHLLAAALAATVMLAAPVYAYEFSQTIETPITVNSHGKTLAGVTEKNVTILKVKLTDKDKQALAYRKPLKTSMHTLAGSKTPAAIQLGMNGVPVLNQGRHGSCVTFSARAALNSALGKGDYISQLCSLELGTHLERNGYIPSGWNGSWGPLVLEQALRFGIVAK